MNRKEIIILLLALLFVLIYHFFSRSEIIFPAKNGSRRSIQFKKYIPPIPQNIKGIRKINILNLRGDTIIRGRDSEEVKIYLEVLVAKKNIPAAEKFLTAKQFIIIDGPELRIDLSPGTDLDPELIFTNLTVDLPRMTVINIDSRQGNFTGRNIQGTLSGSINNSKLSLIKVFNKLLISSENSNLKITEGHKVELNSANSNSFIEQINKIVKLKTNGGKVNLININGDIELTSNNTSIQLKTISAGIIHLKNRYKDIRMHDIRAEKIRIHSFGTTIYLDLISLKDLLYIDGGKYGGEISLNFPKNISPKYDIQNKYGEIFFNRQEKVTQNKSGIASTLFSNNLIRPWIVIKNSYMNIEINNSK
jgi:hypothetical protein